LKAGKREAEMLRYVAQHGETDSGLVAYTLNEPTISYEIFVSAAAAVFRGTARPDYATLIARVRQILGLETSHG
jgi:HTH-type transcriptional regulator, competence development regulator